MRLFFDLEEIDLDDAVSKYDKKEFKSSTRSTVPLLYLLKHDALILTQLLEYFGIKENLSFHLEYKVKPNSGKGVASQTDLLVTSKAQTLGIEAKWTEPRYPTVDKWINNGASRSNRLKVLNGWFHYLNKYSLHSITYESMESQVYQMIHRAASICSLNTNPIMAYLLFTEEYIPEDTYYIEKDLSTFWKLLGKPSSFPFYFIQIKIEPNSNFQKLKLLQKGKVETREAVMKALRDENDLFSFKDFKIRKIK